jgi:ferric-dicitrate binding protein FerR (iron transport regulator)
MKCPTPELLAAMAEERLDRRERDALLDHAADCDDCRHALLVLGAAPARSRAAARTRPAARSIPWAVAAALFIAIIGLLALTRSPEEVAPESPPVRTAEVPPKPRPEPPPPPLEDPAPPAVPPVAPRPELPPSPPPAPPPPKPPAVKPPEAPVAPAPPAPPAPEKPSPAPPPVRPATLAVVAVLDRAEGDVFVLGPAGRFAVKAGQSLRPGDGLECSGSQTMAHLVFPDLTRLETTGDALIREISDARGKRVRLERGTVAAWVARQPDGQPMVFSTPHGEAKVLGTTLRLHVDPDPKKGTRLEVAEGRVELRNAAGRPVTVEGGHQAVAALGVPLASRLVPREEVLLSLDFEDGKLPAGVETGAVERGPANRLCLAGVDAQGTSKVFIGPPAGLFHYQGDEVLAFDYWVDGSAAGVNLNVWNRTQKVSHEAAVPKLALSRWTRVTFKLSDMGDPAARLKEGDLVANLYVQGTGGPPSRRFYIDNVQFSRPWSIRPRK